MLARTAKRCRPAPIATQNVHCSPGLQKCAAKLSLLAWTAERCSQTVPFIKVDPMGALLAGFLVEQAHGQGAEPGFSALKLIVNPFGTPISNITYSCFHVLLLRFDQALPLASIRAFHIQALAAAGAAQGERQQYHWPKNHCPARLIPRGKLVQRFPSIRLPGFSLNIART